MIGKWFLMSQSSRALMPVAHQMLSGRGLRSRAVGQARARILASSTTPAAEAAPEEQSPAVSMASADDTPAPETITFESLGLDNFIVVRVGLLPLELAF